MTSIEANLDEWAENGQLVVRYIDPSDAYPSAGDDLLPFPICPNASMRNIAGVCDPTGRVFGLMPHPKRITAHGWARHGLEKCPNTEKVKECKSSTTPLNLQKNTFDCGHRMKS